MTSKSSHTAISGSTNKQAKSFSVGQKTSKNKIKSK
jgi:hypothetical protein